jgi:hypothetical protein
MSKSDPGSISQRNYAFCAPGIYDESVEFGNFDPGTAKEKILIPAAHLLVASRGEMSKCVVQPFSINDSKRRDEIVLAML